MIELQGKYNTAKVFTDNIDSTTISQIIELCNQEYTKDTQICIMPDCHAGKGCVIGTTMEITDKVVPNLVGVDIACGMHVVMLGNLADYDKDFNVQLFDSIIKEHIPHGTSVRGKRHAFATDRFYDDVVSAIRCKDRVDLNRAILGIGTLGGGK